MDYKTQPIDTSDVKLNRSLQSLMEELARHNHDIWAMQRMAEGWTYGSRRDDKKKTHPDLVDYADLPESEKQYDRNTASETLKCIIKLGYAILEPVKKTRKEVDIELSSIIARLSSSEPLKTEELISLWLCHDEGRWLGKPEVYLLLGERILERGEALLSFDILSDGLKAFSNILYVKQVDKRLYPLYLRLRQQQALALAQCGASYEANQSLMDLYNQGLKDGETLGILGRTFKDLAMESNNAGVQLKYLQSAFNVYHKAFIIALKRRKTEDAYYNGINAATLSFFLDKRQESGTLAGKVRDICLRKIKRNAKKRLSDSHWLYGTLGETELLLNNPEKSEEWYKKAGLQGKGNFRDLASMRKQARLILDHHGEDPLHMDHCFKIPPVTVFVGHMFDRLDRPEKRFPEEMEGPVRKEISKCLHQWDAGIGYASAACGSDIIFLEEMVKRGGEINIILPFEKELFRKESVDIIPGAKWGRRFDQVVKQAARVEVMCQFDRIFNLPNFEFANLFLYGTAFARAQMLDTELKPLAVWDGRPGDGPGGTDFMISHWKKLNQGFEQIDPKGLLDERDRKKTRYLSRRLRTKKKNIRQIKYNPYLPMLFADVKGYSQLNDEQLANFSIHFLKSLGELVTKYKDRILSKRTQGDSLFLVFRDLITAAQVAIDLRDRITGIDWSQYGLPEDLSARISLDAGPCYSYTDPVVGHMEFCGAYVNRAARIEPITPPGHIYASESYVALAKGTGIDEFQFNYVGQVILPKNYGTIPAYHVQSKR